MAKMRGIKPEIWTDDKFVELDTHARLLFIGMWNYACDNGHLDDKPKQIKMRVLPTDSVDAADLISQMVELGMVVRSPEGLTIAKLREHQRIDDRYFTWCDRCAPGDIPEKSRERHASATSSARSAHAGNTSGSQGAPALKEGRKEGTEGEGESESAAASTSPTTSTPRKKPAVRLPADWRPTDEHLKRCVEKSLDPAAELEKFRAHAEANDRRQVSWNAAFTQWLLTARPVQGATVHQIRNLPDADGNLVLPPLPAKTPWG